jgi:hypothetical protein
MNMNSNHATSDPAANDPVDRVMRFADVLREEMLHILRIELPARTAATTPKDDDDDDSDYERIVVGTLDKHLDGNQTDLAALCLSGGGIRSATFALGVLQTLARFGLLNRFHYLSSVSGGGYIASWLSTWRKYAPDSTVLPALNQSLRSGKEPAEIVGLRKDSNYLTPRLGLLSADTWTLMTLYVRNLLLNWILFVPFFMGCFMAPRVALTFLDWVGASSAECWFIACRLLGGFFILAGLSFAVYGRFRQAGSWLTNGMFRLTVLLPLVISSALFTTVAVLVGKNPATPFHQEFVDEHVVHGILLGLSVYFIAWAIGRFLSLPHATGDEKRIEPLDVFFWTLSGGLVGFLVSIVMSRIATGVEIDAPLAIPATVALGLTGIVLAYLLGELLYVGLASFARKGDMDREWLARSSGWLSATAVGWAVFCGVALYGPGLLFQGWRALVTAISGITAGTVTLVLGSSKLTAATKAVQTLKNVPYTRIASGAAIVFAIVSAALLALLDQKLENLLFRPGHNGATVLEIDVFLLAVLIIGALLLSLCINVNRFSLHALYRNRLVRAFPGSARAALRKADPFTSFDPNDNLLLAEVAPKGSGGGLFHIINAALNVVSTKNPAWQERKAEAFTMSRLHCGNPYVRYRPTKFYGGRHGGLTLGTAVAISGAAVSPNQGYNSSPLIGFLLMLFNIRLGWWLGSPKRSGYPLDGPTFSLTPALRELAGDTTDKSQWIYLSDGGHFENLGLYEMVRRRCRTIVISDAGCDAKCTFEDLGNAVRKIFIDFGVSIDFEVLDIAARKTPPTPGARFAIGSITYPGCARKGWLLYIKPTFQGTERADIRSYAAGSSDFPHESTTDQWFSESQFESYRALGATIAEYVCGGGLGLAPQAMNLDVFKETAEGRLRKASTA